MIKNFLKICTRQKWILDKSFHYEDGLIIGAVFNPARENHSKGPVLILYILTKSWLQQWFEMLFLFGNRPYEKLQ